MAIETLDDVLTELADLAYVYGGCTEPADEQCPRQDNGYCCRVNFMLTYAARIREAVRVERALNESGEGK